MDVVEDGVTFEENASIKARAYARAAGIVTFADDSGLEVDLLDGAPGLYTARYGGAGLSDQERYQLLLTNLADAPLEERTARFRCVIAMADKEGNIITTAEGICPGRIGLEPKGSYGFGYDPVFLPDGKDGLAMAELPSAEKHKISHRARALQRLKDDLIRFLNRSPGF